MDKKKIIIFSIKGKKYGHGHFIRSRNLKNNLICSHTKIKLVTFNSDNYVDEKLNNFFTKENKEVLFIFDISNYFFFNNKKILKSLKKIFKKKFKILIIDGFDRNCLKNKIDTKNIKYVYPYFSKLNKKNIFSGTKYFIFDKQLKKISKKIPKISKKILITFGGSDLNNVSFKFANLLVQNFKNLKITVIVGPFFSKSNIKNLNKIKNIKILNYKDNIHKYFNSNDFFITSGGLTKYELCLTNKQILVYVKTKSEINENKLFKEKKLAFYLNSRNSEVEIINFFKKNLIKKTSKKVITNRKKYFDHKGSHRILNLISEK
ncbi:hypothetical protein OAT05_00725 [Candidatus Pelagibacter sp.]|nr:hypothetical protein [Candidatus Pelagibacter sp.]